METSQLLDDQQRTGEVIQQIIRNYKKDPSDRKTSSAYFDERLRRLQEAWNRFQETDSKLRDMCDNPLELEYFAEGYYDKISAITHEYIKVFSDEGIRITQYAMDQPKKIMKPNPSLTGTSQNATQHGIDQNKSPAQSASDSTSGIIRRLNARLTALRRLLIGVSVTEQNPVQYFELKIATITKLWDQIELFYDEVHERVSNPIDYGLRQDEYDSIYDLVQEKLVILSVEVNKLKHNMALIQNEVTGSVANGTKGSSLHLPKVTIPQFDGDYLKWRQFHDLFSEMVDKQQIPAIQKMWYLKSNLSGEAEHLISQFSLSETNYHTAWTTLKERYNNKRILVANLVEKIINQPIVSSSASTIKALHDTTKECLLALNNLGIETSSWDAILIQLLIKKLDKNTHIRYMQSLANPRNVPAITDFLSFLELQFQSMEAIVQRDKPTHKAVSSVVSHNASQSNTCTFCNIIGHKMFICYKFRHLSEPERLRWVQQQKRCVNCFSSAHTTKTCTSNPCKKCGKRHNTLLHLDQQGNSQNKKGFSHQPSASGTSDSSTEAATSKAVAVTSAAANNLSPRKDYVLLATARVRITATNGNSGEFRAILDSGSQVNLVSERVINRLSISTSDASLCIDGIGNGRKRATKRINVKLQSRNKEFSTDFEAYVLPTIIPPQPNQHIDVTKWNIPNIELADPQFYQQGKIDILLGAEFYFSLIKNGKIELSKDLPIFVNTALGWIVSGKLTSNHNSSEAATCAIFANESNNSDNELLSDVIERLWRMDNDGGSNEKELSQEERHFARTYLR